MGACDDNRWDIKLFDNNVGFYFHTFDDRIVGPLIDFLSNNKNTIPAIPYY